MWRVSRNSYVVSYPSCCRACVEYNPYPTSPSVHLWVANRSKRARHAMCDRENTFAATPRKNMRAPRYLKNFLFLIWFMVKLNCARFAQFSLAPLAVLNFWRRTSPARFGNVNAPMIVGSNTRASVFSVLSWRYLLAARL